MPVKKQRKSNGLKIPEIRYGGRIITKLLNDVYYKLNHVLIIFESQEAFRLLVVHNGTKIMDETYKGLKNARIAFENTFRSKRFYLTSGAEWSDLYEAERSWVKALEDTPRSSFSTLTKSSKRIVRRLGKGAGRKERLNQPMSRHMAAASSVV
jgi:hypothetical protein